MTHITFRSATLALAAALLAATAGAQLKPSTVIRRNANEVMVDLVVTNRHGQIIKNLQSDQLQVLDNGKAQKIDSFRLVSRSVHLTGADLEKAGLSPDLNPQPFNLIVFVYDRVTGSGRQLAKQSSDWFLQHDFAPGDFGAVYRIDNVLYALSPVTKKEGTLAKAIQIAVGGTAQQYRQTSLTAQQEANQAQADQAQALSEAQQAEMSTGVPAGGPGVAAGTIMQAIFSQMIDDSLQRSAAMAGEDQGWQSLTALRSLVDGLALLPGRKEILYYSQSLGVNSNTIFVLRALIHDANRNHVSFYAIDPTGLALQSSASEIAQTMQQAAQTADQQVMAGGVGAVTGAEANLGNSEEDVSYSGRLTNLTELANATGGFVAARTNNLNGFMTKIGDDITDHYELTYQPTTAGVEGYHAIVVKVLGHPHWVVRARKGYYATPLLARPARSYELPLLAELNVQPPPSDLTLATAAYAFPAAGNFSAVRLETRVPMNDLAAAQPDAALVQRAPDLKGKDLVRFTLLQVIRDSQGRVVANYSKPFGYSVPPKGLAQFRRGETPPFVRTVLLPPGAYTMQTVLYQAQPKKATVVTRTVTVPAAGKVRLSGVMVLAGALAAQPAKKGAAAGYDPLLYQDHQLVPNLRSELSASTDPHSTVGFYFVAAVPPGTQGATVSMSFAKDGATFVQTPPTPLPAADAQGRIPFLANIPLHIFPAGKYQVTVTVQAGGASASSTGDFTTVAP
ncbi:MAG: VWA domain-containing protein [Terriglobales bacterium]